MGHCFLDTKVSGSFGGCKVYRSLSLVHITVYVLSTQAASIHAVFGVWDTKAVHYIQSTKEQ